MKLVTPSLLLLTIVSGTFIVACSSASDDVVASDEDDLTGGIVEGTPEAAAVLRVANEKTATELQINVGLTEKASRNIVAYRLGPDMTAGSSDDRVFETLAELDKVTYVNSNEFRRLLKWARDNGYIASPAQPTDLGCSGAELEASELIALFAPGTTTASLGAYTIEARSRECTGVTGCTAWQDDASALKAGMGTGLTTIDILDPAGHIGVTFSPPRGAAWLSRAPLGSPLDASAMASLLEDASGFTFAGSVLKHECGALRASKKAPLDGVRTKETEVTVRALHSPAGGMNAYFTTPREMAFSCIQHHWGYQYTCQGRTEYDKAGAGSAKVQLSSDGKTLTFEGTAGMAKYSSDFDGTYTFDATGRVHKPLQSSGTSSSLTASRTSSGLQVSFDYDWTSSANWCGASSHLDFHCVGVLVAP